MSFPVLFLFLGSHFPCLTSQTPSIVPPKLMSNEDVAPFFSFRLFFSCWPLSQIVLPSKTTTHARTHTRTHTHTHIREVQRQQQQQQQQQHWLNGFDKRRRRQRYRHPLVTTVPLAVGPFVRWEGATHRRKELSVAVHFSPRRRNLLCKHSAPISFLSPFLSLSSFSCSLFPCGQKICRRGPRRYVLLCYLLFFGADGERRETATRAPQQQQQQSKRPKRPKVADKTIERQERRLCA